MNKVKINLREFLKLYCGIFEKKGNEMQVTINIPDEFVADWNKDRFDDTLHRLSADAHLIAGNYEQETAKMLADAFKNAVEPNPDTVNRKAVLDILENIDCSDGVGISALKCEVIDDVKAKVKNLPPSPSRPHGQWIPCSDPSEIPKDKMLWVTHDNGYERYVEVLFWDMTEWSDKVSDVVAYMPYYEPEPYKEGAV